MKTHVRILLGALFMAMTSTGLIAQSGIFESYLILDPNGNGNTFYDLQANTGNPDFQGANLGSFSCTSSLVLNGAQNKTFKCASDDITGGSVFYRVYPEGNPAPDFSEIGLGFLSNDAGAGPGCQNQTWQTDNANADLLDNLDYGTYVLEVFTQAPYNSDSGSGIRYSSNGGANFSATFTVVSPLVDFTGSFCNGVTLIIAADGTTDFQLSDIYNGYFDGCDDITVSMLFTEYGCPNIGTSLNPVTATDSQGNSVTCLAPITVVFINAFEGPVSGCGCDETEFIFVSETSAGVVGSAGCLPCNPGTFCNGRIPTVCPPGTFNDLPGQAECQLCPSGTFQGLAGSTECLDCTEGTQSLPGSTTCVDCGPGFYQQLINAETVCTICPPGSYCPDGIQAIPCEAGLFNATEGATACIPCAAGTANNLTGQTACASCPPGSFSNVVGQAECALCPAGTFQDQSGATACEDCADGTSSSEGSVSCQGCPADQVLQLSGDCTALVPDLTETTTLLLASPADFSSVQGDVWEYGMYPFGGYSSYTQLPNWTGFVWNNPGGNLDFPQLDANGGHPELDDAARMAVRRWVSNVDGIVRVFGDFFDRNTGCGDGVNVRIFKNGVQFYEYLDVPGSSVAYSQEVDVVPGDNIDFVIDRKFDGGCDDTHFTNNIDQTITSTQSPEAGTVIYESTLVTVTTVVNGVSTVCETMLVAQDVTPPVIECELDFIIALDALGSASVMPEDVLISATDNCSDVMFSLSQSDFNCENLVGATNVTLTATDESGNSSTCKVTVGVEDLIAPSVVCQDASFILDQSGNAFLNPLDLIESSGDNCSELVFSVEPVVLTCDNTGMPNTVVVTATDIFLNTATCESTVLVFDTRPPTVICKNITLELDVNGNASIVPLDVILSDSDICIVVERELDRSEFTCADLGPNTVTVTVTDANGNTDTCEATVTVVENVVPFLDCQDITVQLDANGSAGITAEDLVAGAGNACGTTTLTIDQSNFSCADIGANEVLVTATDGDGNVLTCTATVTVQDNSAPTVVCQNITIQLDANGDASINPGDVVSASGNICSGVSLSVTPSDFTCADLGANAVLVTATDANGNTATCTATVTVEDLTPPAIVCNTLDVFLNEAGFAEVSVEQLDGGSTDNCTLALLEIISGQVVYSCEDVDQSFDVEIQGTDASGNASTCVAQVNVFAPEGAANPCGVNCPGSEGIVNPEAGCGFTSSFTGSTFNANGGIVYCISGPFNGGTINVTNGSTLRLSGSGNLSITVGFNATLEILSGADITFNSLSVNWGANGMVVYPGASVLYNNTFSPNSVVVNCGEFTMNRLQLGFNGDLINNGEVYVNGASASNSVSGDFVNNGFAQFAGNLTLNFTGVITNNCHMVVDGNLTLNRALENYSFVEVGGTSQLTFNGRVNQFDGAMFETGSTTIAGRYTGTGAPSLVKVLDNTQATWNGRIEGALYFCDEDGIEQVVGNNLFQSGAIEDCNLDIEVTDCNPRGHVGFAKSNGDLAGNGKGDKEDISAEVTMAEDMDVIVGQKIGTIEMAVYPNPTNDNPVLTISETFGDRLVLELYDINGRLVRILYEGKTEIGQHFATTLDLSQVENGLYLVRAVSGAQGSMLRLVVAK